jgi:hypothetical protein
VQVCIPALGRLRQEDCKVKASLGYIVSPCLKKIIKRINIYVYLFIYIIYKIQEGLGI